MPSGKSLIAACLILIAIVNVWMAFTYLPSLSQPSDLLPWKQGGGGGNHVPAHIDLPRSNSDGLLSKLSLSSNHKIDSFQPQGPRVANSLDSARESNPRPLNSQEHLSDLVRAPADANVGAVHSPGAVGEARRVAGRPVDAQEKTASATTTTAVKTWVPPAADAMAQGLPLCNSCYDYNPKVITMYFDQFARMNNYFGTFASDEKDMPTTCHLPDGVICRPQHTDKKADIVFKSIQAYTSPIRHCHPQIVAILNSEAVVSGTMNLADIRVDHHLSGGALYNEACGIPAADLATRQPPDPKARRGTGLFLSNCGVSWRSNFIKSVMDHTHIDSYGRCFHNQKQTSDRHLYLGTFSQHASQHRTVITFENTIQADYISEKIMLVYESGAIPVYWGPPEIYLWVPGNHSFIDASKYAGRPKDLADYLKRIDEDDDLFRYHTTNLDTDRTLTMQKKYCENKICRTCRTALAMRRKRYENGCG